MATRNRVVGAVIDQHVDDLVVLWNVRAALAVSGHAALRHLLRADRRVAAHEDGCSIAGRDGDTRLTQRLAEPSPPVVFAVALVALQASDRDAADRCLAAAEALPDSAAGLVSALGWVERDRLSGIGKQLLESPSPFRRRLGLAACRVHRVDPGPALLAGLKDEDPGVRAEALRTAGELGRHQLVSTLGALNDADAHCQFWASWSAVLLGDRTRAVESLLKSGMSPENPQRARAFRLALQAMTPSEAHKALQQLGGKPEQLRWLIQGSGINGDPTYVGWLIKHMNDDKTARLAGEAFSLITGTDLALLDLERKPPEHIDAGPNDNPDDENVEMDPDDGLPWPDATLISRWWEKNGGRFQAGARYFMGGPVTREHCIQVLKDGYQRQRMLAAHYLCLLEPGTPLFNTSAPAWRQQKLLAQMG